MLRENKEVARKLKSLGYKKEKTFLRSRMSGTHGKSRFLKEIMDRNLRSDIGHANYSMIVEMHDFVEYSNMVINI